LLASILGACCGVSGKEIEMTEPIKPEETPEQTVKDCLTVGSPPPAAVVAYLESRRLVRLFDELGTVRWMGADDGWDRAIEAVRARIQEEYQRVLTWQAQVEKSETITSDLLQNLQEPK
jgi:hypothetical protein